MAKMVKPGTFTKYGKTTKTEASYNKDDVRAVFNDIIWNAVGRDASTKLSDLLWDKVFEDVSECSNYPESFNYDDVRLAFGRVLMKRLGVEE